MKGKCIVKKIKKLVIVSTACCLLLGCTSAYGANQTFKFSFTSKTQKKQTVSYAKEDNEQNAYVTLLDTSYSDFIDGEDVFGCRIRRKSNDNAVTKYKKIKKVGKYVLPYTKTGYKNVEYYLRGQIDSTGEYDVLHVQGKWLP